MKATTDVVIAGGGIIGCATAYYLSKAGVDVTVLDQGEIGAEASSAAAGILAPLGSLSGPGPFADLLLASFARYPSLVPELEEASGISLEFAQTGALRIVRNVKNISNLQKRLKEWLPLGLQMHWLSGDEARQYEQLLAPDVCAAVYAPQEAQIKAPKVMKAFSQAAARAGAQLYSNREIVGIQTNKARVSAVNTASGETLACNHLVLATGAWSGRWSKWLHCSLPVSPQRGQILTLRQANPPLRHIIFGEAVYLAPKSDSTIIVGATREDAGFEKRLTAGGVSWLLNTALRLVPALENCAIEQMWTGLRPKTPDQQPILGPAPHWENVTLATGHGSVGIMLSPITGESIAELVISGKTPKIIQPFTLDRFAQLSLT